MNPIYRQTYDAIEAEIATLTIARDTLGRLLGISAPTDEKWAKPSSAARPKAAKAAQPSTNEPSEPSTPKPTARVDALKAANEPGPGRGRKPSAESMACRHAVLLALLAAPAALSFVQVRDAIAPVMAKNGVTDLEVLTELLRMVAAGLQNRLGFIERAAGAWKLTEAGRAEAVRVRAAVRAKAE